MEKDCTAVLANTSHANCCTTLTNQPSRGRRGRFVRVVQHLACEVFQRTAVPGPAGPTLDTCRSSDGVDVASLKNRSGDPQITHIRYSRRSCRRSLMSAFVPATQTVRDPQNVLKSRMELQPDNSGVVRTLVRIVRTLPQERPPFSWVRTMRTLQSVLVMRDS